ncbi:MAG: Calx-beta domain-containing protein, partial [Christensenellales bacterium]
MKEKLKKIICIILVLLLGLEPLTEIVYAWDTDNEQGPNGQTWEKTYPNGAFIFKESYLYSKEGGDTVAIAVYRMGGRDCKAVANLAITPVAPDGNTANAAGLKDFEIISPEGVEVDLNNEYDTVFADLVFEEGEYVKSLEIRAIDDELSEPEELFIVTIYGAEGAEFIEDGNRFTVCVQDNDPYVKSRAAFAQKELCFDKSGGTAILEVVRTEGTQYVFSVDYEAVSGTAFEGVDFAKTSGTLLFNCGQKTATIEIPLINDNKRKPEPDISFTVKLSNPKGGDIAESGGKAEVYLYNSAAGDAVMNIATLVTDFEAVDISEEAVISDEAIASNTEEITVLPEVKESVPLEREAPVTRNGGIGLMSIVTPAETWKPEQGSWKKYTRLAYDKDRWPGFIDYYNDSDDFYEPYVGSADNWHTRSSDNATTGSNGRGVVGFGFENENRVWKVWDGSGEDPYGYAIMKEKDLDRFYEYYQSMTGHASMQFNDSYFFSNHNVGKFIMSNIDTPYDQLSENSRTDIEAVTDSGWKLAEHSGKGRGEFVINENLKKRLEEDINNVQYDRPVMAILDYSWENNTVFNNWVDDLYVERAAIDNLQYEVVCKDGDNYLEKAIDNTTILNQIKPNIKFYNSQGGTDAKGRIYVGSHLQLDVPSTAGAFKIARVELRKKEGDNWIVINKGELKNDNKQCLIRLHSGSPSKVQRARDLSCLNTETGQYSLYVVMERKQRILMDYSPCVLPLKEGETHAEYQNRARLLGEYLSWQTTSPYFRGYVTWPEVDADGNLSNAYMYVDVTDVTNFNYSLEKGEQLLYNGEMYSGS